MAYSLGMPSVRDHPELSPLGLTHDAFVAGAVAAGSFKPLRASEVYSLFHREAAGPLAEIFTPAAPVEGKILRSESPEGEVVKFLLPVPRGSAPTRMPDMLETESVVIPMQRRHETTLTLCVSSQVGCAMGCTFCETAQMGLIRSLTTAEIVAQVWAARHHLKRPVRNVVFMGMGEPLDNLDNVLGAVDVLTDHRGLSVGVSRITISTVGRIDGLMRLSEVVKRPGRRTLNLAVSINAPSNEIRDAIMPINRAMPLEELVPILETWPRRKSGAICLEYVLIPGVNDRREHAEQIAKMFRNVRGCVNVIPYNPRRSSPWPAPDEADVARFLTDLESFGQFCKRRRTKGRDTMAACGQLGNEVIRKRQVVGIAVEGVVVGE